MVRFLISAIIWFAARGEVPTLLGGAAGGLASFFMLIALAGLFERDAVAERYLLVAFPALALATFGGAAVGMALRRRVPDLQGHKWTLFFSSLVAGAMLWAAGTSLLLFLR